MGLEAFGEEARGVRVTVCASVNSQLFTSSHHYFPSASHHPLSFFFSLLSPLMILPFSFIRSSLVRTSHSYISSHHAASLASISDPPPSPTSSQTSLSLLLLSNPSRAFCPLCLALSLHHPSGCIASLFLHLSSADFKMWEKTVRGSEEG